MSNTNDTRITRIPGDGFNCRLAEEKPTPIEPAAKVAPTVPVPQFSGRALPDSDSKRARLLPGFDKVADQLSAGLAVDEAVRRSQVTGHLNIEAVTPVNLDATQVRENLGAAVRRGEITEVQANTLWREAFGNRNPESK